MHLRACLCGQHGCPRLVPHFSSLPNPETGKFPHASFLFWDGWAHAVLMIAASGRPIEDAQKQPLGSLNTYAGYIVGCAAVFPFSVLSFQLHDGCWCATFRLSCVLPLSCPLHLLRQARVGQPLPIHGTGLSPLASSSGQGRPDLGAAQLHVRVAGALLSLFFSHTCNSPDQSAPPPIGP